MMRVLDLTQYVAGPFATLLLAEAGAEVIKIERPGTGDPLRTADPIRFNFLNRRKRSLTLDLKSRRGRALFRRLAAGADAVIENYRPGTLGRLGISFRGLRRINPGIVLTSISNFGRAGPRRDWEGSELVLQAMGGIVESTGARGGTPMRLAGDQAAHIAGINAATTTLAAVVGAWSGRERGVHIDIAIQEAYSAHWVRHIQRYIYSGHEPVRGEGPQVPQPFPDMARARDGYLYLLALRTEWETFAAFLGMDGADIERWLDPAVREAEAPDVEARYFDVIAGRDREDWMAAAATHGYTLAPVAEADEVLANRQFAARGFFKTAQTDGGSLPCAGLPFALAATPGRPNRAPDLGEDTEEICRSQLGLSDEQIARLRRDGVI
jgi:crotonobetainyl-CoA:carnitine CoA-transferase CaiB-like acyl-CoA transferase